ncbi:hypothetical protein [Aeromicrobium alkaliterrae]|uniref:PH domain-containing protein n=1 Tax=Aeromicrobium alkaliterrae TaxID=302168 RepID=A0ABN2JJB6_9ACTN
MPADAEFSSDRRVFVRYAVVMGAMFVVMIVAPILAVGLGEPQSAWLQLLLAGGALLGFWIVVNGALMVWWWWHAGRTTYVLGDGVLTVEVRGRVVLSIRMEDVYVVQLEGGLSWRELIHPLGLDDFPRLVLRGREMTKTPRIALWRGEALRLHGVVRSESDRHRRARRAAADRRP